MKKLTCPCGAEFKTHTEEEMYEIANVHVKRSHPKDYPNGMTHEAVRKMTKEA